MREPDFYQPRPDYWGQTADNLARWLGLQHVTGLDIVILLPLFPLLIVGLIMWMPWEPWVWKSVPKTIIGLYLLYCAFAFWHFHAHWWLVSLVAISGVGVCGIALREIHSRGTLWRRPQL